MARLPLAGMEKMLRVDDHVRVSESAKATLRDLLEAKVKQFTVQAESMAKHANRKTIMESDVAFVMGKN